MILVFAQAAGGLFTVPAIAGAGALAVSVPIAIHLMRQFRRRPEPWGAMRFLLEAYQKQRKRLRVERLLLLAVRCLLVLVAGFALAGPVLSGCAGGAGFFTGDTGRVVYLLVDDALSTQTREAGGTRLDRLKAQAFSVIDELGDTDRAVVVRAGRPPVWVTEAPTGDRAALRAAVEGITARDGRSGLGPALMGVASSLEEHSAWQARPAVVLLSDFSRSAPYLDEPVPPELEGLGRRASVVAALPAQGAENFQVVSVTPRRRMVVAAAGEGGAAGSVGVEVRLRRFGNQAQPGRVGLRVRLLDESGAEVASAARGVRWLAGQRDVLVNLDLPLTARAESGQGGRGLLLVARLLAANESAGVDALEADDVAGSVVVVRERLRVALIDDGSVVNPDRGALQPRQWMRAALAPGGAGAPGPFEVTALLPSSVNRSALGSMDAAVVLRPDRLTAEGWGSLAAFAQGGGLVWVWAPASAEMSGEVSRGTSGGQTRWADTMFRVFELPWAVSGRGEDEAGDGSAPAGTSVDSTTPVPEALQYLAADWREKLGWVTVAHRLPLRAPEQDQWIRMDTAQPDLLNPDAPVLMAGRPTGSGAVLLTAVAPDARATNLVVRPLFAPLVHDTLRGVLGDAGRLPPVVAGDAPDLGHGWRHAGRLVWLAPLFTGASHDAGPPPLVIQTDDHQAQVLGAIERPGFYRADASSASGLLAVSPDASAGDTYPAQSRLEQWLDRLGGSGGIGGAGGAEDSGGWSYFEDLRRSGSLLPTPDRAEDLTWPLLWVLLGLVIVEMFLARRFSHALAPAD